MSKNYWLLLEKSDETRTSKGIDSYRDQTGEVYQYDSLVPNYRNLAQGDFIVLRKEADILGIGKISRIEEGSDKKKHRRCPECQSTDIRSRTTKQPKWKCGKCSGEFSEPQETIAQVRSFLATIEGFSRLSSPPSVAEVKQCAAAGNGESSQLSMIRLDASKILTLVEGVAPTSSLTGVRQGFGGQGFGLSQPERDAVELRAMNVVRELYTSMGWKLIDKSRSHPYDFLARRGEQERFIEVKGTTGRGASIILTHGEVKHVLKNRKTSVLVVVSGIVLVKQNGVLSASGGTVATHEDPWTIDNARLKATQYRYEV